MSSHRSALRYPLDHILGTDSNVRVLRVLARHGGALSTSQIAAASGLPTRTTRVAAVNLEHQAVLKVQGTERARLFSINRGHPLAPALTQLFASESQRYESVLDSLRTAARQVGRDIFGLWLYGSVARGEDTPDSDLDIAIVTPEGCAEAARARFIEEIESAERAFGYSASVIAIDLDDVARLAVENDPWWTSIRAEARALHGRPPDAITRAAARERNRTPAAAP